MFIDAWAYIGGQDQEFDDGHGEEIQRTMPIGAAHLDLLLRIGARLGKRLLASGYDLATAVGLLALVRHVGDQVELARTSHVVVNVGQEYARVLRLCGDAACYFKVGSAIEPVSELFARVGDGRSTYQLQGCLQDCLTDIEATRAAAIATGDSYFERKHSHQVRDIIIGSRLPVSRANDVAPKLCRALSHIYFSAWLDYRETRAPRDPLDPIMVEKERISNDFFERTGRTIDSVMRSSLTSLLKKHGFLPVRVRQLGDPLVNYFSHGFVVYASELMHEYNSAIDFARAEMQSISVREKFIKATEEYLEAWVALGYPRDQIPDALRDMISRYFHESYFDPTKNPPASLPTPLVGGEAPAGSTGGMPALAAAMQMEGGYRVGKRGRKRQLTDGELLALVKGEVLDHNWSAEEATLRRLRAAENLCLRLRRAEKQVSNGNAANAHERASKRKTYTSVLRKFADSDLADIVEGTRRLDEIPEGDVTYVRLRAADNLASRLRKQAAKSGVTRKIAR